jgi:hypothetical protein
LRRNIQSSADIALPMDQYLAVEFKQKMTYSGVPSSHVAGDPSNDPTEKESWLVNEANVSFVELGERVGIESDMDDCRIGIDLGTEGRELIVNKTSCNTSKDLWSTTLQVEYSDFERPLLSNHCSSTVPKKSRDRALRWPYSLTFEVVISSPSRLASFFEIQFSSMSLTNLASMSIKSFSFSDHALSCLSTSSSREVM